MVGYIVLAGLLVATWVFMWVQSTKRKKTVVREVEQREAEDAERLIEIDRLKTALYTNITHEFRTPLTVVTGMAEAIIDNPENAVKHAELIQRNSAGLLSLVNQMLDLSKLDAGGMSAHLVNGDVVPFVKNIVDSLRSFAEQHDVNLYFASEFSHLEMDYDPEKLMHIVSNLVSNGIKFTPEGGRVSIRMLRDHGEPQADKVILEVEDTGIGILPQHLPHIFDRFYRVEDTALKTSKGTGIGLALTKGLVELLGGQIAVDSTAGEGTVFTVTLPVRNESRKKDVSVSGRDVVSAAGAYAPSRSFVNAALNSIAATSELPNLLIIEDNPDVVEYLKTCLNGEYNFDVAGDGESGIQKALETVPDIIISDVMMPMKDGFEVCDTLKTDERTSHIPIILLTAKADIQSRLEGLETGADAYLAKPFHREELRIRLRKLLELRQKLQERYNDPSVLEVAAEETPSKEDEFILKLRQVIHENIDDTDFGITQVCRAMALSRTQMHNKIKALTGRSTSLYIRVIRLQKAKELLRNPDLNISEIAYDVGFKDPAYFSRCFSEEYGIAPSAMRETAV